MKTYSNISGKSGVIAFEIGKDFIKIKFADGNVYLYDHKKPGKAQVTAMKQFAEKGRGLSTYISRKIKTGYSKKL